MELKLQNHFIFSNPGLDLKNTAFIHIRRTYSNIFVTLTDLNANVIVCKSSGSSGIIRSKRRKKAPQALENIVNALMPYLKLYELHL